MRSALVSVPAPEPEDLDEDDDLDEEPEEAAPPPAPKRRFKRHEHPEAVTLAIRELARDRREGRAADEEPDDGKRRLPLDRSECRDAPRPCPHVSCKYHLLLDVQRNGSILVNFPDAIDDLEKLEESCALDVADRGEHTLEDVAWLTNVVRERVRQIEAKALRAARGRSAGVVRYLDLLDR